MLRTQPHLIFMIAAASFTSIVLGSACKRLEQSSHNANPASVAVEKQAITYLRSQGIEAETAIEVQSSQPLRFSQNDLCQTVEPLQPGWQIILTDDATAYTVHANEDSSQIELCSAQDKASQTYIEYVGAGYRVKYPVGWRVIDAGLEPTGANRVQFFPPDRNQVGDAANNYIHDYIEVTRYPSNIEDPYAIDRAADQSAIANFESKPYDLDRIDADSAELQTYQVTIKDKSGRDRQQKVKVLLIKTNAVVYKIKLDRSNPNTIPDKAFEQFISSFSPIK